MKIGDVVRIILRELPNEWADHTWPECDGQVGVIVAMTKRVHIPAAKVMVLGEVAEFDLAELEIVNESK